MSDVEPIEEVIEGTIEVSTAPVPIDEAAIMIRVGEHEIEGRLMRIGNAYHFIDLGGQHISAHVWRLKTAEDLINESE